MLSILIPVYNYNIIELVNIIWQQCKNESIKFEIIVLDDFSTDLSLTNNNYTIEKLKFCKYYNNNKNIGRTATRNILCNKSKYSWLLFLDADVIPKYKGFISNFNLKNNKETNVIYGGVSYDYEKPIREKILRWEYGRKKEEKNVQDRLLNPYFIISQNLMIKKDVFINSNTLNDSVYGLDILFSNNLKKNNINVKHIDNPVLHLGLEKTSIFLNKSLDAVKTTYVLEERSLINSNLRPLQKSYLFLKKWKLLKIFSLMISLVKNKMEKNFYSLKPNLIWFDLYRLAYFIDLKLGKNA